MALFMEVRHSLGIVDSSVTLYGELITDWRKFAVRRLPSYTKSEKNIKTYIYADDTAKAATPEKSQRRPKQWP